MIQVRHYLLALLFILPLTSSRMKQDPAAYGIVQQMFGHTKKISSMQYTMKKEERIGDEIISQESFAKVTYEPYRAYTKQLAPKEGVEALYVEGKNKNQAFINPNGFPWLTLSLDPYGKIMRKKQHHTILDAGYRHVISILEFLFQKYGEEAAKMATLTEVERDGEPCWKVVFENPKYTEKKQVFQQNETVMSWAQKQKLSEYMILLLNPQLDGYDASLKGKAVVLPNDYCPKMTLVIEKQRMIPLLMEVYDRKGLYERYEYSDVTINPSFTEMEFSPEYKEYGF